MVENEVLVLLLSTVVLGFIGLYRKQLLSLPAACWLLASYLAAWFAWLATVVEHVAFPAFFNVLEHLGYMVNGVLLFVWCWFAMTGAAGPNHD